MHLMCDFNGRKLKDLSLLCCISILLKSMEGRIVDIVQVKCSFELVYLHVFYDRK
jgi:hypothetical protein